jgi:hypothetical protein
MEARSQTMEARSQTMEIGLAATSQIIQQMRDEIVARDAPLAVAHERSKLLEAQLSEKFKEVEMLRSNLLQMTSGQNDAGNMENAFNIRITQIELGLDLKGVFQSMESGRVVAVERRIQKLCESFKGMGTTCEVERGRSTIQDFTLRFKS